jgi:hypothetical protein
MAPEIFCYDFKLRVPFTVFISSDLDRARVDKNLHGNLLLKVKVRLYKLLQYILR